MLPKIIFFFPLSLRGKAANGLRYLEALICSWRSDIRYRYATNKIVFNYLVIVTLFNALGASGLLPMPQEILQANI